MTSLLNCRLVGHCCAPSMMSWVWYSVWPFLILAWKISFGVCCSVFGCLWFLEGFMQTFSRGRISPGLISLIHASLFLKWPHQILSICFLVLNMMYVIHFENIHLICILSSYFFSEGMSKRRRTSSVTSSRQDGESECGESDSQSLPEPSTRKRKKLDPVSTLFLLTASIPFLPYL